MWVFELDSATDLGVTRPYGQRHWPLAFHACFGTGSNGRTSLSYCWLHYASRLNSNVMCLCSFRLQVIKMENKLKPLILEPNDGRQYPMGRMSAVFKADLSETNSSLSVSEWWLEPNTEGPNIHNHVAAHLFYIIEGNLAVYLQDKGWFEVRQGSYIYIPGGTDHGFENWSEKTVGFMSINTPGGFEEDVPNIVAYFAENPLGDAKSST